MQSQIAYLLSLILMISGLFSCDRQGIPVPERTLQETIIVNRHADNTYTLDFMEAGKWKVFKGDAPDNIDWSKPIAEIDGSELVLNDMGSERVYFGVISPEEKRFIVAERRIYLQGAPNFRDIGGLPTKDGRIVQWGKIYRSGELSGLNAADLAYLQKLNLKTVCDFRFKHEVKESPDRLPKGVKYYNFPIGGEKGSEVYAEIRDKVISGEIRREKAKETFIGIMRLFADTGAYEFKPVLDLLAEEKNTPLVYHCAGGKDRTGFMTSMVLAALNVDEEVIKNEYLMSNLYREKKNKRKIRAMRLLGIDQETLKYAFIVQEAYLDAVFDFIKEEYGDVDTYLEQEFGLDSLRRREMIEAYTYSPLDLYQNFTDQEASQASTE